MQNLPDFRCRCCQGLSRGIFPAVSREDPSSLSQARRDKDSVGGKHWPWSRDQPLAQPLPDGSLSCLGLKPPMIEAEVGLTGVTSGRALPLLFAFPWGPFPAEPAGRQQTSERLGA